MLSLGFQSHKQKRFRFRIPDYIKVRYNELGKRAICFAANELNRAFSLTWPTSVQIYWNKRKRLHKKKEFNVHRIGLGHQYGRRDVM